MTDKTEDLIDQLSQSLKPVKRLAPPTYRAGGLTILATFLIAAVSWKQGLRPDLAHKLTEASYVTAVLAAWLTGVTATLAALEVSLPGGRKSWAWLPLPSAILWIWGVGWGCLLHWVTILDAKPVEDSAVNCLTTLIAASIPLTLALWLSVGKAKPLERSNTAWLSAVAVAAFADVAHLLCHVVEATVFVLLMNLGTAATIVAVLGLVGGRIIPSAGTQ
jgi:hypothetical protein